MPSYTAGGAALTPFGGNEYLRSTQDVKKTSYTLAAASVATETIDGVAQKIMKPGEVLAKITSGPDTGKVGPYDTNVAVTDGRQTAANIVGINDTFLPWQLLERDAEVAVTYEASVIQSWCFERVNGVRTALTNAAVTAINGVAGVRFLWK